MSLDAAVVLAGQSPLIREVASLVQRVTLVRSAVVIRGESGTGASALAAHIHANGPTRSGPFVHVVGTMSAPALRGTLDTARDGSVYIEHVTHLDTAAQHVLSEFMRRETSARPSPRIIASSETPLDEAVRERRFASDLYYRLNVLEISLPALRDRRVDIPFIAARVLKELATEMGVPSARVEEPAIQKLLQYNYPGNLVELCSMLERAMALCDGGVIGVEHVQHHRTVRAPPPQPTALDTDVPDEGIDLDARLAAYERLLMEKALLKAGGVRKAAAKLLGVTFRSLRYRLSKHGMDLDQEERETPSDGSGLSPENERLTK